MAASACDRALSEACARAAAIIAEARAAAPAAAAVMEATMALVPRLQRAKAAFDVGELVAILRESVALGNPPLAGVALQGLCDCFITDQETEPLHLERAAALEAADGSAAVLSALDKFHLASTHGARISWLCSRLLAWHVNMKHRGAVEAAVAGARLLLAEPPAGDDADDVVFRREGFARLLGVAVENYRPLRAEAIATGAVERLLEGCKKDERGAGMCLKAITKLVGDESGNVKACSERIAAADGVDLLIAALGDACLARFAITLLHPVAEYREQMAPATAAKIRRREHAILKGVLAAMAPDAHLRSTLKTWAECFYGTIMALVSPQGTERCEPRLAAAAVDGVVAVLRAVQATSPSAASMLLEACFAATILYESAGCCGGDDTASPGVYALRAGALPLLETAMAAAEGDPSVQPPAEFLHKSGAVLAGLDATFEESSPPEVPPQPQPQPQAAPLPQAAPPPLPPWLLQAVQRPPPPAPPPPPAITAGLMEVPRELECAICLDSEAVGRTPCCGQTAFCARCAAALTGECPLCRALPGGAVGSGRQ